jgi:D-aminoacyl-tRNA deacylase
VRAVVQRVTSARVTVDGETTGQIGPGLMVLLGISPDDTEAQSTWLADKVANLRIFEDDEGKMNRSLLEAGGAVLLVSQFTLYGDARKGRRPSFIHAAQGPEAEVLYERCIAALQALDLQVETGKFGAVMDVELVNAGPVTILLDSEKGF